MEPWKQCAQWLIKCRVLPPNHRVTWDTAQVFDLAQTLRDGVLLCQLLNNLNPESINLKEINLRPQMSQFLCLKNIRTFLLSCCETFGMKKNELFEAFDLFDVRDFAKVIETLSRLSHMPIALSTGIRPFPTEESVDDEDVYKSLPDLIDESGVDDDEELYDCVYGEDEGGEVYEDLMKVETASQPKSTTESDIRSCCLLEIKQTEEKYTETLESIEKFFMLPLKRFLSTLEFETVFINIPDLVKVHKSLMQEIQDSITNKNDRNLYQVFIIYKERLVIYGQYCSQVETAISCLDTISKTKEDVKLRLEECSKRANNGKFTLRDLLVVPMQRVLKYHLLLQELVKHTSDPAEKENLKLALDAMKDLAQYVNEVKRDNETLREINQFQLSIENMNQSLLLFGRPKVDGEIKMTTIDKRTKQDRHIFLFDQAVIVCKRRGDNYEMKEIIDLKNYKITNNPSTDKENKKWSYGFYLTHIEGQNGFEFYFKTKDWKKKWIEQFEMALSNIRPDNANSSFHEFKMHTFARVTSCKVCQMLLRGTFYQGYLCSKCGTGAHKECLGRSDNCGRINSGDSGTLNLEKRTDGIRRTSKHLDSGLPKMRVIRNYSGIPQPPYYDGSPLNIQSGDTVEVIRADAHSLFWQGRNLTTGDVGFFPSEAVKPCPCVPKPVDYSGQSWYAGAMERLQAEAELMDKVNSTYLVRYRTKESGEYAISIKYNNDVKHIKILTRDGLFLITENRKFKSLMELVEYYKHQSLKEGFRSLDTTLQFPYKEPENSARHRDNRASSSLLSPKVLGIAIARYDFCARDMRELSLLKGDVVKIYTKMSPNGWWRGEVNGRVGWFPSTYVEEDE
ncbi:LOW QUALITY PROTEIN: guanine nucleotide exchange factor VAV3 [Microcaecilia unicolor]|uniref:LOW QUALITY PROTEIN: guanine nucleotide exchange factor VAV3 n=1 Tax=Microcaecilia unicolor TaxID=1415580 RepID=A0A6P7YG86_9AMPH|nr:LOW QUALITY PROTEIN: guanine nucleotide exchange factor VAV3 [Microcaecilia unicolor]